MTAWVIFLKTANTIFRLRIFVLQACILLVSCGPIQNTYRLFATREDLLYLALFKVKRLDGVTVQILLGKLKSQFLLTLLKIRKRYIMEWILSTQKLNSGVVQIKTN